MKDILLCYKNITEINRQKMSTTEIIKQSVGIDVAQKELVVTLARMQRDFTIDLYSYKVFPNNLSGFKALVSWVKKNSIDQLAEQYVMEATGVYHQKFAYFLEESGEKLSIILPNKISSYMKSLNLKTITDKSCSQSIARFALERKLENWKRPGQEYKQMQKLTRERDQTVQQLCVTKNQLHAEMTQVFPNSKTLERLQAKIDFFKQQKTEIENDLNQIISMNPYLKQLIKRITTIPGVGNLTAATVLAETNGFELIRNKKQLASYAGFDIKEKQSGTSVKGKPKISKKGNKHLRKAMHMPSLSAISHSPNYRKLYERLLEKNNIKMKGIVAVQRKLLELIFILYKNKSTYDPEFEKNRASIKYYRSPIQTSF